MCGIAGLFAPRGAAPPALRARLRAMTDALAHRGPDGEGHWCDPEAGIALGHRRLAIIDLSPAGAQPMHAAGAPLCLTYNGEIYNYPSLRAGLEAEGVRFRGASDTEVLLELIARRGLEAALDAANGMFALALWDGRTRTLALARDRFGQKPLAYGWVGGQFAFASELGAFEALDGFDRTPDRDALGAMLMAGAVAAPASIYGAVRKLPPGGLLVLGADATPGAMPAARRWWSPETAAAQARALPFRGSAAAAAEALAPLLDDAVRGCMLSDVPLGAFLSGGLDSSSVVAAMRADGGAPRSFTIGFAEPALDESAAASAVAAALGSAHTVLPADGAAARAIVPELGRIYDEPFADSSQIPTVLLARLARRHVTVALSGDGGDEIFGGYARYGWLETVARAQARRPAGLRPALAWLAGLVAGAPWLDRGARLSRALDLLAAAGPAEAYARLMAHWADPRLVLPGCAAPPLPRLPDAPALRQAAMLHDSAAYLPEDILVKLDRATMSVGLEARVPLLDHRLFAFAHALPPELLADRHGGKAVLRHHLAARLPPALAHGPKRGFGVPLGGWLRGPLRDWAESLLAPATLEGHLGFAPRPVRDLWQMHLAGTPGLAPRLWCVLMAQAWSAARPAAPRLDPPPPPG